MRLMREIRCYPDGPGRTALNTWAGTGEGTALGAYRVLRAVVEGPVDRRTGYMCDLKEIDRILWRIAALCTPRRTEGEASPEPTPSAALAEAFPQAARQCPPPAELVSLELCVSPHTRLAVGAGGAGMIRMTQSFEFSAAHRLFCKELSDDENRRLFGKCSNPNGHGHNYVVEVTVCGTLDAGKGTVADVGYVDRVVLERVIESFDHKNLNVECPEFAQLNPSVENIARVIWNRLEGAFVGCRLGSVRVWETPKTCAEYTGDDER